MQALIHSQRWNCNLLTVWTGLILFFTVSLHFATASEGENIDHLILQLGSDSFREREKATRSLRSIGRPALPALCRAITNGDLELRRRADIIITQIIIDMAPKHKPGYDQTVMAPPNHRSTSECATCLQNRRAIVTYHRDNGYAVSVIRMEGDAFGDDDLVNLYDFDQITLLSLSRSRVTDAGIIRIAHLVSLESLYLGCPGVTDITPLGRLTKLTSLRLAGTKVTDTGLSSVKLMRTLRGIDLSGTNVTDAGLFYLRDLKDLMQLDLSYTKISDAGLVHLRGLTNLQYLRLSDTQVTDAGLDTLKSLTNLRGIYLQRTRATSEGIEQLKKVLPLVDKPLLPAQDAKK